MADRRRHFAQGGQFAGLLQRLFGHRQRFLNPFALSDFPLQGHVQCAKFGRLALEDRQAPRRAPAEKIKRQGQQNRKPHDFQRQNGIHPFAHTLIGGKTDHAPTAKGDPVFQTHHCFALQIGVSRQRGPIGRGLDRALDR
ncbi:tyrosinase family protein [Sulfitobacter geojensis]|uniref:tyrosinase family protein n=1 Tax=Sulfitobacter geojensis TaxID=1342299 RepID=UPI00399ACFD7